MNKCKICHSLFYKTRAIQPVCDNFDCKVMYATKSAQKAVLARKKRDARETKEKLDKIKHRSQWLKEVQSAFNKYIRTRDAGLNCICCNIPMKENKNGGTVDCGHYRSVGSAPHLRFDERNAHAQRKQCNQWGSGRAVDYRLGIIKRYGVEYVESIEADQSPRNYTIDDLKALKWEYKLKCKQLENLK